MEGGQRRRGRRPRGGRRSRKGQQRGQRGHAHRSERETTGETGRTKRDGGKERERANCALHLTGGIHEVSRSADSCAPLCLPGGVEARGCARRLCLGGVRLLWDCVRTLWGEGAQSRQIGEPVVGQMISIDRALEEKSVYEGKKSAMLQLWREKERRTASAIEREREREREGRLTLAEEIKTAGDW